MDGAEFRVMSPSFMKLIPSLNVFSSFMNHSFMKLIPSLNVFSSFTWNKLYARNAFPKIPLPKKI